MREARESPEKNWETGGRFGVHHGVEKVVQSPALIFARHPGRLNDAGKTEGGNAIEDNLMPDFHGLLR